MKQVLIFLGLTLSLLSGADASASVSHFLYTPLPLTPVSTASSEVKIAGIYWLPDYLKDNVSRDHNSNTSDDKGGGDKVKTCADYGFVAPEDFDPEIYECDSEVLPVWGLNCYVNCKCASAFIYDENNCNTSAGYVLGGRSCLGKYESCTCYQECCSDSMCRSDQRCSSGACVCGAGYKSCNGVCIPSSDCCTDADCGSNEICTSGSCGCASGYKRCNGVCIPSSSCCTDADCGSDQNCSFGSCVDNCTPLTDETGCSWGSKSCSDGCKGYRSCCKTAAEYCLENGYAQQSCAAGETEIDCPADSNYQKCEANPDCSVTPVAIPENAVCSARNSCDVCTDWDCGENYYQSGKQCYCSDSCSSERCWPNAVAVDEQCSACGVVSTVKTYQCPTGYQQNSTHYACQPVGTPCEQVIYNNNIYVPITGVSDINTYWGGECNLVDEWVVLGNVGPYSGNLPQWILGGGYYKYKKECEIEYPESRLILGEAYYNQSYNSYMRFDSIPITAQSLKFGGNLQSFIIDDLKWGEAVIDNLEVNTSSDVFRMGLEGTDVNNLNLKKGTMSLLLHGTVKNVTAPGKSIIALEVYTNVISGSSYEPHAAIITTEIVPYLHDDIIIVVKGFKPLLFIGDLPAGKEMLFLFTEQPSPYVKDNHPYVGVGCDETGENCTQKLYNDGARQIWKYLDGQWQKLDCTMDNFLAGYPFDIVCLDNGQTKHWVGEDLGATAYRLQ